MRLSLEEAMSLCRMKVVKPSRRPHCVMRWIDPRTGEPREKTTGTASRRKADQAAADRARAIAEGIHREKHNWLEFCRTYESEHLTTISAKSRESWRTTKRWLSQFGRPQTVAEIDAAFVVRWQAKLRKTGMADTSIGTYSARLKAALHWAEEMEIIPKAPRIRVKATDEARSRAITREEFERMLMVAEKVRAGDYPRWQRFLRGLWESGFRLSEVARLSWDGGEPVAIDLSGHFPAVRFAAKGHKKRKYHMQPIPPDFWDLCCETPEPDRSGPVFLIPNGMGGQLSLKRIGRYISKIGRRAGVKTNPETGKCATAQDFRRAFATRFEQILTPGELQKWMRHVDIKTTMTFYHHAEADQLAAKVWGKES